MLMYQVPTSENLFEKKPTLDVEEKDYTKR